jgi:hypothetical protein
MLIPPPEIMRRSDISRMIDLEGIVSVGTELTSAPKVAMAHDSM